MKFDWKGIKDGKFSSGSIDSSTQEEAVFLLKKNNIIIINISDDLKKITLKKNIKFKKSTNVKISDSEYLLFTRKFAAMIKAGLAIVPALEMLVNQTESQGMKKIISNILDRVNSGIALSKAFEDYPLIFDTVYINLVRAGEASGKLDLFLLKIASNISKKIKIVRALKSATRYPIILMSVAIGVVGVMMIYVVPIFVEIFRDGGVELPLPTTILLSISDFVRSKNFVVILILLYLSYWIFKKKINSDKNFKVFFDKRHLKLPLIGLLTQNAILARFSEILSNLVAGGVNLIEAIDIARGSINNLYFTNAIEEVKRKIYSGQPFALSLRETNVFPETFCGFVEVGEETGNLNEMLETISIFYEDEFDNSVSIFSQMLEPIMIVFLAIVIGFILISLYLPIFKMGTVIGG